MDAPQQRKKDKKKKKKGDEDSEMTDPSMDKGLKRSASGMEAAAKGLERKHSKKIKVGTRLCTNPCRCVSPSEGLFYIGQA